MALCIYAHAVPSRALFFWVILIEFFARYTRWDGRSTGK
jgi:hypothetical protein